MNEEVRTLPKKRKRRRLVRGIVTGVVLLLFLGLIGFFLAKFYFVVREVEIGESSAYSYEEILAASGICEGEPLITLPVDEIAQKLESGFTFLSHVTVTRELPGKVVIRFTEGSGVYLLHFGEDYFSVNEDLFVLAKGVDPNAEGMLELRAKGIRECVVGNTLIFEDESMLEILRNVIAELQNAGIAPQVQVVDGTDKFNLRFLFRSRFSVLLGENEDIDYKIAMAVKVADLRGEEETGIIEVKKANTAYFSQKNITRENF